MSEVQPTLYDRTWARRKLNAFVGQTRFRVFFRSGQGDPIDGFFIFNLSMNGGTEEVYRVKVEDGTVQNSQH